MNKHEKIKNGMLVKHKNIDQVLTVVSDEKGPAYTGNDFKDDEIALSYAIQEYNSGNLTIELHTEEGFTKGEWSINPELERDENMCPIPYYKINNSADILWVAHVAAGHLKNEGEAEANAHLIAASKDMYYALKEAVGILEVWKESDSWDKKDESVFTKILTVLQKANPKL
jgi:hypothetical protein